MIVWRSHQFVESVTISSELICSAHLFFLCLMVGWSNKDSCAVSPVSSLSERKKFACPLWENCLTIIQHSTYFIEVRNVAANHLGYFAVAVCEGMLPSRGTKFSSNRMATKLNEIFCQYGTQKKKWWDDLLECLLLLWGHLPWGPALHRCCLRPHSRSLPALRGGGGGIHGPSMPWHCGAGPFLLVHAQSASPLLMVSATDHQTLFFEHCQSQSVLLLGELTSQIFLVSMVIESIAGGLHVIRAWSVWCVSRWGKWLKTNQQPTPNDNSGEWWSSFSVLVSNFQ